MKRATPILINRLLSRGEHFSADDKAEMLEHVLERSAERRRVPSRVFALWAGLGVALAMTVFVVLHPFHDPAGAAEVFTPRGNAPSASLALACTTNGVASPCHSGAHVLFKVSPGASGAKWVSIFAVDQRGQRFWYLTGAETSATVDQAVVLGPEQGAGTFDVVAVLNVGPAPLDKQTVRDAVEAPHPPEGVTVVHAPLVVEP